MNLELLEHFFVWRVFEWMNRFITFNKTANANYMCFHFCSEDFRTLNKQIDRLLCFCAKSFKQCMNRFKTFNITSNGYNCYACSWKTKEKDQWFPRRSSTLPNESCNLKSIRWRALLDTSRSSKPASAPSNNISP